VGRGSLVRRAKLFSVLWCRRPRSHRHLFFQIQAVIRCKKAQAVARPYNQKKKIKAGTIVEAKLSELLAMTKKDDFGELTGELELLEQLVKNMQKSVLEPLLESVETIERRMKAYQNSLQGEENINDSTRDVMEENESHHEVNGDNAEVADGSDSSNPGVTAVQQRFLDRLAHFFDFQGIAEERVAIVDPQGKIAGMKVKPHSKGIEEKNGTFKPGYRQQDIRGKPVRHLTDLYQAAEAAKPEFEEFLDSLLLGVGLTKIDRIIAPLKPRARASQKAIEEYTYRIPGPAESWLYDILRASIICKSFKQMNDINKFLSVKSFPVCHSFQHVTKYYSRS
jgi:hypothetical protein